MKQIALFFLCIFASFGLVARTAFATTWDVSITSTGYVPQIVQIAPGDTVRWTNNDLSTPTRGVNSDPHDTHSDYPALDFDDIPQGDSVELSFSESCWRHGYHDHEKDEDEGAIFVNGPCPAREPDKPIFWGIAVTRLSQTSALLEWSTERGSYTKLEYGTTSTEMNTSSSVDDVLTKFHRAEISGLTASTTYYYHAIGGMGMDQKFSSETYRFSTLPPLEQIVPLSTTTPTTTVEATSTFSQSTSTMMHMADMPGMSHHHTGMGVSAYAIRTVHTMRFPQNLGIGARGEAVRALQIWLVSNKFLAGNLPLGYFGQLTKNALIRYQMEHDLPPTGYLGALTRKMIDDMGE